MDPVKITFVIGKLSDDELEVLNQQHPLVSKMILSLDDYKIFRYKEGDSIQAETDHGNRLWCTIKHLEIVEQETGAVLIFTLIKADEGQH
jgi:hypothetical protein